MSTPPTQQPVRTIDYIKEELRQKRARSKKLEKVARAATKAKHAEVEKIRQECHAAGEMDAFLAWTNSRNLSTSANTSSDTATSNTTSTENKTKTTEDTEINTSSNFSPATWLQNSSTCATENSIPELDKSGVRPTRISAAIVIKIPEGDAPLHSLYSCISPESTPETKPETPNHSDKTKPTETIEKMKTEINQALKAGTIPYPSRPTPGHTFETWLATIYYTLPKPQKQEQEAESQAHLRSLFPPPTAWRGNPDPKPEDVYTPGKTARIECGERRKIPTPRTQPRIPVVDKQEAAFQEWRATNPNRNTDLKAWLEDTKDWVIVAPVTKSVEQEWKEYFRQGKIQQQQQQEQKHFTSALATKTWLENSREEWDKREVEVGKSGQGGKERGRRLVRKINPILLRKGAEREIPAWDVSGAN